MAKHEEWVTFTQEDLRECECRCGDIYVSWAKLINLGTQSPGIVTEKKCPGCGRDDDLRVIRSLPENYTIKPEDIQLLGDLV